MKKLLPDAARPSNDYLAKIRVVAGDITTQPVDAIVTMIPQNLEYRGEINSSILKAAGEKMDAFLLENIYRPRAGDVYAIPGFALPCRHIFFCVRPVWRVETDREDRDLVMAARRAMELARSMSLKSIAFPPMGSGKGGYPRARGARLLLQGIFERPYENIEEIKIVCPDPITLQIIHDRLASQGWKG